MYSNAPRDSVGAACVAVPGGTDPTRSLRTTDPLATPEGRSRYHQQRENLQPTEQHRDHTQPLPGSEIPRKFDDTSPSPTP